MTIPSETSTRTRVRLRPREYGEIYSLIERCLAVGDDPYAWRLRFVEDFKDLFDAAWVYIGEHKITGPMGSPGWIRPYSLVDVGFQTDHQREIFWDWVRYGQPEKNPMVELLMSPAWFGSHRLCVMPRVGFIDDETWHSSEFYDRFSRPIGLNDMMGSSYRTDDGDVYWLVMHRERSQPQYTRRDRRRLAVLTHLLMQHVGSELAGTAQDSVLQMPRRQRQVLARLLGGDGEKQVATHLGISVHTVSQYIQRMHKRFGVDSRVSLMLLTGVAGPLLDSFFLGSGRMDRRAIIATKGMCQIFGHGLKLIYFGGIAGDFSLLDPTFIVLAIAATVLGTSLAKRFLEAMSETQFRFWAQSIITAISVYYIAYGSYLWAASAQAHN